MFIQDPGSDVFHPGSRVDNIADPYQIIFNPKTDTGTTFLKIRIPALDFFPSRIRIQGSRSLQS
jgi:hypothetical protein